MDMVLGSPNREGCLGWEIAFNVLIMRLRHAVAFAARTTMLVLGYADQVPGMLVLYYLLICFVFLYLLCLLGGARGPRAYRL